MKINKEMQATRFQCPIFSPSCLFIMLISELKISSENHSKTQRSKELTSAHTLVLEHVAA